MDFKERYRQLFYTCRHVLTEPKKVWKDEAVGLSPQALLKNFYLPLVVLVGLGVFLGQLIFSSQFLLSYALAKSLREVVSYLLQYFMAVYLLNELLTGFGGEKNKEAVNRLVAYSFLPFLLMSFVVGLFPGLYALGVLGLYGIYLFVQGVKESLVLPLENQNRYTMVGLLLIFLIFLLLNVFSWKLLQAFYGYGA